MGAWTEEIQYQEMTRWTSDPPDGKPIERFAFANTYSASHSTYVGYRVMDASPRLLIAH